MKLLGCISFSVFLFKPAVFGAEFGDVLWEFQTGDAITSSPTLDSQGNLYFGSIDGFLYSLDRDGNLRWKYDSSDWIESSPALDATEAVVYVGSWSDRLLALNASTGSLIWDFTTSSLVFASPAIGTDGTIYFGSSDGFMYALRPDGTLKWEVEIGGELDSSPAIDMNGNLYFGTTAGNVFALDSDGNELWEFEVPDEAGALLRDTGFTASPMLTSEGDLIIGCQNFFIYCLNTIDGSLTWKFETGAEVEGSCVEGMGRSVLVSGRDGFLYSFDWNGNLNWKVSVGENFYSTPCVDGIGRIYVGGLSGSEAPILSVVSADGQLRWTTAVGSFIDSSPNLDLHGRLFVGSNDGKLYAIEGGDKLASLGWARFCSGLSGRSSLEGYQDLTASPSSFLLGDIEFVSSIGEKSVVSKLSVFGGGPVNVSIRGLDSGLQPGQASMTPTVILTGDSGTISANFNEAVLPWSENAIFGWLEPGEYQIETIFDSDLEQGSYVGITKQ